LTEGAHLKVDPNRGQSSVFFVGAAEWGWDKSDDAQTRLQMRGIETYGRWLARQTGGVSKRFLALGWYGRPMAYRGLVIWRRVRNRRRR